MATTDDKEVDINELAEYESDEETAPAGATASTAATGEVAKKDGDTYASIHSSGFKEFFLKPELMWAIVDCGFEHPSQVQHECIPQAILGTDVLCQAKSGMGKTAVFVLAVLQQLAAEPATPSALVICHTRELAYQIKHEFDRFKKHMPAIKTGVFYGGVPVNTHRDELAKDPPHIVIGTPGRVKELAEKKFLKLAGVKHFVLDEADQCLQSLDMRGDVQKIFLACPRDKQVMMFSATLNDEIRPICKKFMHNPLEIYINEGSKLTLHGLQQYFVKLKEDEKTRKLIELLDALEFNQCVIFVNSVNRASVLNKLLAECNFPSECIHSGMKQEERIERYRKFKDFQTRIMVSTNIFGRGIDVERVNVVINYDMPDSSDTYLHRVGRAGRFGTKGLAISFVSTTEDAEVLEGVQSRFVVNVPTLPDHIPSNTYMNS